MKQFGNLKTTIFYNTKSKTKKTVPISTLNKFIVVAGTQLLKKDHKVLFKTKQLVMISFLIQ